MDEGEPQRRLDYGDTGAGSCGHQQGETWKGILYPARGFWSRTRSHSAALAARVADVRGGEDVLSQREVSICCTTSDMSLIASCS